jgi:protein O-GlcNAc transferase
MLGPAWAATSSGRHGLLRVGYVSSHLNHWACGRDMLHVLRLHDRTRLHTVCYPLSVEQPGGRGEVWQSRIREQCGAWVVGAGIGDSALARKINADGVHVLVNLNGWITGHRSSVLALGPAPVQVSTPFQPATSPPLPIAVT